MRRILFAIMRHACDILQANFKLLEAQATSELYLKRGTLTTKGLGMIVLAGSTSVAVRR